MFSSRADVESAGRDNVEVVEDDDGLCTRQLGLFWLYLDPDDAGYTPAASRDGFWESWVTLWMDQNVPYKARCLDVGANHGYYSFFLARKGCEVWAAEPQPKLAELIRKSENVNGLGVRLLEKALSDREGVTEMKVPKHYGMNGTISNICYADSDTDESIVVSTTSLDILNEPFDFIKIDAEGAEHLIWSGGTEFREKNPHCLWLIEWRWDRYAEPEKFALELLDKHRVSHLDFDGTEHEIFEVAPLAENRDADQTLILREKLVDTDNKERAISNLSRKSVEVKGSMGHGVVAQDSQTITARILNSFDIVCHSDDASLTPCLVNDGFWESWITSWLTKNLFPGQTFIDVGANCGYYTMLATRLVGKHGRVVAYEPNPVYAQLLRRTRDLNDADYLVREVALSDTIGKSVLSVPENYHGSASIVSGIIPDSYELFDYDIETTTLDQEVQEQLVSGADVIKIDAEGAEELVWRGAKSLLGSGHPITLMIEYSPNAYSDAFLTEMFEWGSVFEIDFQGGESPVVLDDIRSASDWKMLVIRSREK